MPSTRTHQSTLCSVNNTPLTMPALAALLLNSQTNGPRLRHSMAKAKKTPTADPETPTKPKTCKPGIANPKIKEQAKGLARTIIETSRTILQQYKADNNMPVIEMSYQPLLHIYDESHVQLSTRHHWHQLELSPQTCSVHEQNSSMISLRDRHQEWPNVFQTAGHIITDRPNMGPAANERQGPLVKDLLFRLDYVLHGDLGAV